MKAFMGKLALQEMVFEGLPVRMLGSRETPLWVLNDVAAALAIVNPRSAVSEFDEDDVVTADILDSNGRSQETLVLTEPGLYRLIFQSRKEEAKRFRRWVTHEVLPTLRRTGSYHIPRPSRLRGGVADLCYATAGDFLKAEGLGYSAVSFGVQVSQYCKAMGWRLPKMGSDAYLYPVPALRAVGEARGLLKPPARTEGAA